MKRIPRIHLHGKKPNQEKISAPHSATNGKFTMRRHFAFFIARENACIYFALLFTIDRPCQLTNCTESLWSDLRSFVACRTTADNYVNTHVAAVDDYYRNKILCVIAESDGTNRTIENNRLHRTRQLRNQWILITELRLWINSRELSNVSN